MHCNEILPVHLSSYKALRQKIRHVQISVQMFVVKQVNFEGNQQCNPHSGITFCEAPHVTDVRGCERSEPREGPLN